MQLTPCGSRSNVHRLSAIGLPSTLPKFPNLLSLRLTGVSTDQLTDFPTPSTNTNPASRAGHVREGEGVERSRVPWVLGGRRGVGDDALCWFLRRRPRAGFMPRPVRPRRVWVGNCRAGDRVDPFAP